MHTYIHNILGTDSDHAKCRLHCVSKNLHPKCSCHVKYLRISGIWWTYGGDDYPIVRLAVAKSKGCCYGNQLNLEDGRRHCQKRSYSSLRRSTTDWLIVNPLSKT